MTNYSKHLKETFQYGLALFVVLGSFFLFGNMLTQKIPAENKDIIYLMIGIVGTTLSGVIQYFFGSSKGSQEKTELLGRQIENSVKKEQSISS